MWEHWLIRSFDTEKSANILMNIRGHESDRSDPGV